MAKRGRGGGGICWVTSTFDPEMNLLYVGTGNPAPDFDGGVRAGDNLFTDCGVAVDPDRAPRRGPADSLSFRGEGDAFRWRC